MEKMVAGITSKKRLKFIDMARSIAILLMLEGHFVDDSLADIYRDPDSIVYSTWLYIRGFTAATFLTVTGLIFSYLLLKNRELGYFENIRVKKGFKRFVELIFWGIVVQFYAFHVLECIAFGILTILIIYGVYKVIRFIPLWIYFLATGVMIFGLYKVIKDHYGGHTQVEEGLIWGIIQIMKPGKQAMYLFPIIPWIGYTMFGAMIGTLIHDLKGHVHKWYFPAAFFVIGALCYFDPKTWLHGVDTIIHSITGLKSYFVYQDWLFIKLGMVIMILGGLIVIDQKLGHRIPDTSLFLKVGQNTLTIYVLHMVVLYGSLIGIGVNDFYHKAMGPWEVALGASLFIAFFVFLIKYIDKIRELLGFILKPIKKVMNRLFFIKTPY